MSQLNLDKFLSPSSSKNSDLSKSSKSSKSSPSPIDHSSVSSSDSSVDNVTFLHDNPSIPVVHYSLPPSYLISVNYDGERECAYLKLYNPTDGKIYRFYDTTGHKPYLLTPKPVSEVEQILRSSKDFVGCEVVEKVDLLRDKVVSLTKVYGSNPLAIGGKSNSFREFIHPSYEATIRYHLNYIYDNLLVPGLLYEIKDGKLFQVDPVIEPAVKEEISAIFSSQSQEVHELLVSYFPTFFSPIPDLPRCSLDIEVRSDKGRIPDPKTAADEIISVGFADNSGSVWVYVLNSKNEPINYTDKTVHVVEFTQEKELIEAVFQKIYAYPVIITFNGDNFDLAYLNKRAKNLGISDEKNPIIATTSTQNDTYLEYGLHLDLYRFFRQASMRIYAFGGKYDRVTLDEIGSTLLGKEKVKHEKDIWDLSLEELIEYNAQDARITLELTTFSQNQVMEIIFMLSRITKMPIDDFIRSSVSIWIQNWLYYEHRKRNYLIPLQEEILRAKGEVSTEAIIKGKKYQGAIVISPKPGVWWNVYVLDYASLYPSIIKTRNLSYETIRCSHKECKEQNKIPETNHWVCTKKVGIISMLIGFIRDVRVYWFKEKAKDKAIDKALQVLSNVMQASLKVLINACLPYDSEVVVKSKTNSQISKVKIGELENCWKEFQILSISREADSFGKPIFVNIEGYWKKPKAELLKVILEDGRTIRLTANHRVPVLLSDFKVEEKYAGDLKINDQLLVVQDIPLVDEHPTILSITDSANDPKKTLVDNGKEGQTIYNKTELEEKPLKRKKHELVPFNGTTPVRIKEITTSSTEPVYDIQTSNGWFVGDMGIVVHNSYGVLGSDNFALYCPPVAESTTALAREAISKTKEYCEKDLGIPVLYGDTDSIFVYQPEESDIEELKNWSLNQFQIELGIDYVFRYCCLSERKKNYFGITTRGTPIVKGLMGKKKNTPNLIKRAFDYVLKVLSEVHSPEELDKAKEKVVQVVQKTLRRLEKRMFKLEDLAITVTLSKRLKDYESWTQPLQAAIQLLIDNPNREIEVGSTITFIKTKPFKITVPSGILNDKISLSDECSVKPVELATQSDVDVAKMKELVKSTFGQLLDTIGISWKEVEGIKSLDTFFS